MMKDRAPKLAIVGFGSIGQRHAEQFSKAGAAIVGAVSPSEASRKNFESRYSQKAYADFETLLSNEPLDGIVIASPNDTHAHYSTKALQKGVGVLCEKPMALSIAEATEMAEASRNSTRCLMMAHNFRFLPQTYSALQAIRYGAIGFVYKIKCEWLRRRGIPGPGSWFTTKARSGGGALIDVGVHLLDLGWLFFGRPTPLTVSGATQGLFYGRLAEYDGPSNWGKANFSGTFDVEDSAEAFIRFDGGRSLQLSVAWAQNGPEVPCQMTLYGTQGACAWLHSGSVQWYGADGSLKDREHSMGFLEKLGFRKSLATKHEWESMAEHFMACLDGADCKSPASDGVVMMKMIEAIYRSASLGKEIRIS